jgi:carbon-monoxide dehydrogenase small subunit
VHLMLSATVNDEETMVEVDTRAALATMLRDQPGLTGTHVGCKPGSCGATTRRRSRAAASSR